MEAVKFLHKVKKSLVIIRKKCLLTLTTILGKEKLKNEQNVQNLFRNKNDHIEETKD